MQLQQLFTHNYKAILIENWKERISVAERF